MPIAIAAAIVVVVLGAMWVLRFFRSDEVPDDGLVGRAVVGQNDALQRENYPDFQTYTCVAQQGSESQVLTDQRQSKSAKGNRFVDDVRISTPTVIGPLPGRLPLREDARRQVTAPMTFVRGERRLEGVLAGASLTDSQRFVSPGGPNIAQGLAGIGVGGTTTSSPARSRVSARTGTSRRPRTTMLTQMPATGPGSSTVDPSAVEPLATVSRCTPLGSSRNRTLSAQGSGVCVPHGQVQHPRESR